MKRLNADIKNKEFAAVYLLYGDEDYLRLQYQNRLFDAVSGGDTMNTMTADGNALPELSALKDFTDTLPFFAEKRTVLLTNTGLFKKSADGYDRWIEELPESACVIFSETEIDKRNRLYKAVSKKGYAAELNHPDDKMISDWILRKIGQEKLTITRDAFRRFLEICDPDMQSMENELRKLTGYCRDKGSITAEDVDLIVTRSVSSKIFVLIDAVTEGRRIDSLDLYYELLSQKESPLRILYLITRQLGQMLAVTRMTREGKSSSQIADALKVRGFVVDRLKRTASHYTPQSLQEYIDKALELENAVKSGDLQENMSVEMLIFSMTA